MARWKDVKKADKNQSSSPKSSTVHYAGFWSRFLAFVTDLFMIGIPITLLIMILFGYDTMQSQPGFVEGLESKIKPAEANLMIPLMTLLFWAFTLFIFWFRTGQTPGKKMAQIVIVDSVTLNRPSTLQLIVRLIIYIMPIFALLSLFVMLFHPRKYTLHDIFSRTSVIYKR